jgi:RIO kinase 1
LNTFTQEYELSEEYGDWYATNSRSRQERRQRKTRTAEPKGKTAVSKTAVISTLTDFSDDLTDWIPSYAAALDPQHHERRWVIESVGHFYRENIITDVTRLVKGGKEANVYVCTAHPAAGVKMIAAKLYRERMLRNLKNDAIYKHGRLLRNADGKQIKSSRERRAVLNKSGYGQQVDFMMWVGTEYRAQTMLYEAGADVPKPIAHSGSTILMEFIGDAYGAAPALNEITLQQSEAAPLFDQVMANVQLMLNHDLIHGDLSAYNILYWEGAIFLIDFPQVIEARTNPHAFDLLQRDIIRVCEYFARFGVKSDPATLAHDLWTAYMGGQLA